jgi:GT2 family glycosyltransferase
MAKAMLPRVTIIVPTFNNVECIRRVTRDILDCTRGPYQLIIVDNGSTLGSVRDYLRDIENDTHVEVRRMTTNLLYWPAVNSGIRSSQADTSFYLALNDDVLVQGPGWLDRMMAFFEDHPEVGIVGDFQKNGFGPLGGWVDGWCALIRKSLVDRIGLVDDQKYPFHYGFVDYQLRAFRHGFHVRDMKAAGDRTDRVEGIAFHERGATLKPLLKIGYFSADERRRLFRNRIQPALILLRHRMILWALRFTVDLIRKSGAKRLRSS